MFAFFLHFQHIVKSKISRPSIKSLPILPIVSFLHIRSSPIGLKILVAPLERIMISHVLLKRYATVSNSLTIVGSIYQWIPDKFHQETSSIRGNENNYHLICSDIDQKMYRTIRLDEQQFHLN